MLNFNRGASVLRKVGLSTRQGMRSTVSCKSQLSVRAEATLSCHIRSFHLLTAAAKNSKYVQFKSIGYSCLHNQKRTFMDIFHLFDPNSPLTKEELAELLKDGDIQLFNECVANNQSVRDKLALVQSEMLHNIQKEGGAQNPMAIKKTIASLSINKDFLLRMQGLVEELGKHGITPMKMQAIMFKIQSMLQKKNNNKLGGSDGSGSSLPPPQ